jgi:polysaccharide pyruvyl transferase WcaK-like protein
MKIGIVTFHSALNCGAVFQAFALQTHLESLGYEVSFINYHERYITNNFRSFFGKNLSKTWYKLVDKINYYKYKNRSSFHSILKIDSILYNSIEELKANPPQKDIYIAGSDQIWNIGSKKEINKVYYLDFGGLEIKRISFAASLGQCNVPEFLNDIITNQLKKFDAISVRETNGVEFIQSLIKDKKVHHISDPTFLLKAKDYRKIMTKNNVKSEKALIVSYILTEYNSSQLKVLDFIKQKLNLDIINLRNPNSCIRLKKYKNKIVEPQEWLYQVDNSKFMICCSFHAVVFSLIFHKPFIVVSPYENARILSLLKSLNLENHFISDYDEIIINDLLIKKIDWKSVDEKIDKFRTQSDTFLKMTLN